MDTIDTTPNMKAVTTVSSRLKGLIMPVDTQHPLLKAVWFKFQSKAFAKSQNTTVKNWVQSTNRFVKFLKSKGYTSIDNTPVTVFNEWGKILNTKTAKDVVHPFKSAADKYLQKKGSELNVAEYDFLSRAVQEFSLQRRSPDKKLPLSMMFADCPFADDELFSSLRLVCANLILLEQHAKDLILSQEWCEHYQALDCDSVSKAEHLHSFSSMHSECRELYRPVFEAITTGNNEYAKELVLLDIIYNQLERGSAKNRKEELKAIINISNVSELYAELLPPEKNIRTSSWLSHSALEEIREKLDNARPSRKVLAEKYGVSEYQAIRICVGRCPEAVPHDLAIKIRTEYSKTTYPFWQAEKEYGVSVDIIKRLLENGLPEPELVPHRLKIDSIGLSGKSWSNSCYGVSNLTSINPVQRWAFAVLLATEGMQTTALELLTFDDIKETESISGKQTIFFDYIKHRTGTKTSLTVEPSTTAVHSNKDKPDTFYRAFRCAASQLRNSLKFRVDDEHKRIFTLDHLWFNHFLNREHGKRLTDRLLNSGSVLRRELEKNISKDDLKPFLWWLERFSKSTKTLPVSPIHESFVLIGAFNKPQGHLAEVAARLSGHSKKTDENTYFARYPRVVKEKLSDTPSLSFRVAQMMAEFADVINAMQSETKVLSKVEIKELLGINHISDAIDIGLLGEFESDHMTVYVADKSTAALILKRLDHLKAEMPRLIQHQRSDKRLVNDVVKEFIKLSDVLAKFPQNLILEGEKHAKKLPSSFFPPIV
jgi:hypothetical protein